jgi:hypothetical protein
MCKITEKLGVKVAGILLVSGCMLAGLNPSRAYGQPLDSPLYNHATTKTVESMNTPAETNSVAGAKGPALMQTGGPSLCHSEGTKGCGTEAVPVMSPPGEIVLILTLIGGACWVILRKKCHELS